MDATRRGEGGGWAPHVLEFMENTVLSTSWLKLGSLSARAVLKPLNAHFQ